MFGYLFWSLQSPRSLDASSAEDKTLEATRVPRGPPQHTLKWKIGKVTKVPETGNSTFFQVGSTWIIFKFARGPRARIRYHAWY